MLSEKTMEFLDIMFVPGSLIRLVYRNLECKGKFNAKEDFKRSDLEKAIYGFTTRYIVYTAMVSAEVGRVSLYYDLLT